MDRFAAPLLLTALGCIILCDVASAQVPPTGRWQTIESAHFRVTFAGGLDDLARQAAERAEAAHRRLAATLTRAPTGRIDILITDNVDVTNGFATPFPSNRIVIFARPPVDVQGLDYNRDWIDLVVTHELTHIFHLDRAGRLGMAIRSVFGRLPLIWPLFPAVGTPRWNIEGLATHVESDFTGMGRVHGSYHEMVVRTAVLEGRFDPFDRVTASSPIWPGDERVYIYGSLYLDHLAKMYGEDVRGRMIGQTASSIIPPFLWFGGVGRRTLGTTWGRAYRAWHDTLRAQYGRQADSLRASRLTEPERITTHGRYAFFPRVSPDGRRLAYAAQDGRRITNTRVVELETGEEVAAVRRNGLGTVSWFPRGNAFAISQLEFDGPYHIYQDLYTIDEGRQIRLTDDARLQDPDVDYHGEHLVAVENGGGSTRLVEFHNSDRSVRVIADFDPGVNWALPRWSPDARRIAVGRWTKGGEYDVVVIDTLGNTEARLTADRAIDGAPAWSRDGRYIVFSSDRTGIPNLYAADMQGTTPLIKQVTNVLGGALYPDVSPDGRWIYFSDYHADGYHIARIPFDPATWRDLPPIRVSEPAILQDEDIPRGALTTMPVAPAITPQQTISQPRGYSFWQSALPKYWSPLAYEGEIGGTYLGAATAGTDLLGRHEWNASAAVDPGSGRWEGLFGYAFAGLGNPVLELEASRAREFGGLVQFVDTLRSDTLFRDFVESEDALALFASFVRRKWRSSAVLSLGAEAVRVGNRDILDSPVPSARLADEQDRLYGIIGRVGYSNYVVPAYAISREDGISLSLGGRLRRDDHPADERDRGFNEVTGFAAAYKSLPLPGFAHHVLAVRGSGLARSGDGASTSRIGGTSGGVFSAFGVGIAGEALLLPVRGFERGVRLGTTAWTASAEYRIPLALIGRRPTLSPLFIDRLSASLFVDAGDAWCTGLAATRFGGCFAQNGGATGPRSPVVG
ncbi:MAG: hypothetical protein ACREMQ_19930, partial [Longimicrobiales bacterium]